MNYKYKQSAIALGVMAAFAMTDVAVASQKQLEEVVVTARKRAENLQDVPMAVSAFSSDQLKDYQVEGITDLERLASNVTLTETSGLISGQLQVFVRGIGNDPGLDQGVGIYVDDVYLNRTTGAVLDVYDVERIEILKGPQGHLYGRNTIGGAIKYVSREPREELEANIEVKVGEFDQRQIKANISGPLIDDKLYGSFGVLNKQRDGTQTNTYDGEQFNSRDVQAYRGTLLFNAADNLKIKLTGDYTKDESMPGVPNRVALNQDMLDGISFVITGNGYLPGFPVLMDEPNDQSLPTDIDRVSSEYTQGYKKFEIETKTAALNVEWDINDQWMLKSVTAGRWSDYVQPFDFDGSEQQFITSVKNREAVDLSQEFQLNYSGDTVSAVLGLYHLDGHLETDGQNLQYPRLRAIQYHIKDTSEETSDLESTSVYGNIDWDFAEDWQLSVGGRYTQDKKTFEKFASVTQGYFALARFNFLPPSAVVAVMPGQESVAAAYPGFIGWAGAPTFMEITGPENIQKVSDTWTEFSPSTRLSYHLSEDTLLYAGISTGFKAGGFESSGSDAPSFDPETVTTYSVGFKTTLLDNRLRLNGE